MEGLATIVVIGFLIWAAYQSAYKAGKREGSRKGYGVGYSRGRKSQSGCMVALLLLFAPMVVLSATMLTGCHAKSSDAESDPLDTEAESQSEIPRKNNEHRDVEPAGEGAATATVENSGEGTKGARTNDVAQFAREDSFCRDILDGMTLEAFLAKTPGAKKDRAQSIAEIGHEVYMESMFMYEFLDSRMFSIRYVVPRSERAAADEIAKYAEKLGPPTRTSPPEEFKKMRVRRFLSWDFDQPSLRVIFAVMPSRVAGADVDLFGQFMNLDAARRFASRLEESNGDAIESNSKTIGVEKRATDEVDAELHLIGQEQTRTLITEVFRSFAFGNRHLTFDELIKVLKFNISPKGEESLWRPEDAGRATTQEIVLMNALAEVVLHRTLARNAENPFGKGGGILLEAERNTESRAALKGTPGGDELLDLVESDSQISSAVKSIEKFRDADTNDAEFVTATGAVQRLQQALTVRMLFWGKAPEPEMKRELVASYMSEADLPKTGELILERIAANDPYVAESYCRLLSGLSQKLSTGDEEIASLLRLVLDRRLPDEISDRDRVWTVARVLARRIAEQSPLKPGSPANSRQAGPQGFSDDEWKEIADHAVQVGHARNRAEATRLASALRVMKSIFLDVGITNPTPRQLFRATDLLTGGGFTKFSPSDVERSLTKSVVIAEQTGIPVATRSQLEELK